MAVNDLRQGKGDRDGAGKGTVYFFTGLAGAGKTTLGTRFYDHLRSAKPNVVFIDGDQIRKVYCEDIGYTPEDRIKGAKRTFRVCKMLSDQGLDVVCCSICMFTEVREWNRGNIDNYVEIYVKVSPETLLRRNKKNLYTQGTNVMGKDLPFDEPKTPDIIIENDGDQTPEEIEAELERMLSLP